LHCGNFRKENFSLLFLEVYMTQCRILKLSPEIPNPGQFKQQWPGDVINLPPADAERLARAGIVQALRNPDDKPMAQVLKKPPARRMLKETTTQEEYDAVVAENEAFKAAKAAELFAATRWPMVAEGYAQPTDEQWPKILQCGLTRGHELVPTWWYDRLVNAVDPEKAPALRVDQMPPDEVIIVRNCFIGLASLRRSEKINRLSHQILIDATLKRSAQMGFRSSTDIGIGGFLLAILCSNDVAFLAPARAPWDLGFFLQIGDGLGARSTGKGWQDLLGGKPITPVPGKPMASGVQSQARIRELKSNGWQDRQAREHKD
jgi:hypothetical protein